MDDAFTLSVEGDDGGSGGLEINRLTSLKDIRKSFPVPEHFAFGVPLQLEGELLASEYQPLVLLNTDEVKVAKLMRRPSEKVELERRLQQAHAEVAAMKRKLEAAVQACELAACARDEAEGKAQGKAAASVASLKQAAATPAVLRAELSSLRRAVEGMRAEASEAIAQGMQQICAASSAASASQQRASQSARSAASEAAELRNAMRAMHQSHEAELRVNSMDQAARVAQLEQRHAQQLQQLQQQVRKLQMELEQADPAGTSMSTSPSSFAEHMRASQLKRECSSLQSAAREFYTRPTSARSREGFMAALGRIHAMSNAVLESSPAISAKCGAGGASGASAYSASAPAMPEPMPAATPEAAPAPASAASLLGGALSLPGGRRHAASRGLTATRGNESRGLVTSASAAAGLLSARGASSGNLSAGNSLGGSMGGTKQPATDSISILQQSKHKSGRGLPTTGGSTALCTPPGLAPSQPSSLPQVASSPSRHVLVSQQKLAGSFVGPGGKFARPRAASHET